MPRVETQGSENEKEIAITLTRTDLNIMRP